MFKAHFLAYAGQALKFDWLNVAFDREMMAGRLKILTYGKPLHIMRA
jgi:hypothetical protein